MIDLNPFFNRKLGDVLCLEHERKNYLMQVIAVSEIPNSVYLEVESIMESITGHHVERTYHGVVEVNLKRTKSVRSVQETAIKTIQTRER